MCDALVTAQSGRAFLFGTRNVTQKHWDICHDDSCVHTTWRVQSVCRCRTALVELHLKFWGFQQEPTAVDAFEIGCLSLESTVLYTLKETWVNIANGLFVKDFTQLKNPLAIGATFLWWNVPKSEWMIPRIVEALLAIKIGRCKLWSLVIVIWVILCYPTAQMSVA